METIEASVHIGDGVVVVRRKGSSMPTIAKVIGIVEEIDCRTIYLDRLVHKHWENRLESYPVKGAISSIITVPLDQASPSITKQLFSE